MGNKQKHSLQRMDESHETRVSPGSGLIQGTPRFSSVWSMWRILLCHAGERSTRKHPMRLWLRQFESQEETIASWHVPAGGASLWFSRVRVRRRSLLALRKQNLCRRRHGGFTFAKPLVKVIYGKYDHVPLRNQKKEPESEERERPGIPGIPNQIFQTHDHGDEHEHTGNYQCQVQEEDQR